MSTFLLPKNYFAAREEEAFVYYIDPQTAERAREEIMRQLLFQPLFHLAETVALRYCPCVGVLGKDELVSQAFEDVRGKLHKFKPGKLNKKGDKLLRAYSYLSAVVKNFVLGYGKDAAKYETTHETFDVLMQERLELALLHQVGQTGEHQWEVARDKRMQRVLAAIKKELAEDRSLRPNDMAVGRALLAVLEISLSQQEGWNDDERISTHYLRRLLMASITDLTGLGNKEVNAGLRRFMPLYLEVCGREENDEADAVEEDEPWSPF